MARIVFKSEGILPDISKRQHKESFSQVLIDDMLQAVDLVDLVENEWGFLMDPQPNGWYQTNCPIPTHRDNSPSFGVNPEERRFKCFGCGEGGDAITLIRKVEGLSFRDAVIRLSLLSGIPLDVEGDGGDVYRALRDIKNNAREFLDLHAEVPLPGAMSEKQFMRTMAERLRAHECKTGYVGGEIAWVDGVYLELDDMMAAEDWRGVSKLWSRIGREMKTRRQEIPSLENPSEEFAAA